MSKVFIDDADPTITKTGNWIAGGSPNEYKQTVSYTLVNGPSMTVPFNGTQIGVYGTYDFSSVGCISSYSIDGARAVAVPHKASANGKDVYKSLFWQSDTLPAGEHTLKVTMVMTNPKPDSEGTVWFDYFQVANDIAAAPPTSPSGTASDSSKPPTKSTPPATTSPKKSAAATHSASAVPAPAKATNTGAIIGGVVVGLLALLALTGLFLFYRNRKKRKADVEGVLGDKPGFDYLPPAPVPYNTTPQPQTPNSGYPFLSNAVSSNGPMPSVRPTTPNGLPALPPGAAAPEASPRLSFSSTGGLGSIGAMAAGLAYLSDNDAAEAAAAHPATHAGYSVAGSSVAGSSAAGGRALTVANDTGGYGDSVVELKQRAKEAMIAEQNQLKQQYPIQHVDSGIRSYMLNVDPSDQMELPPVYSA